MIPTAEEFLKNRFAIKKIVLGAELWENIIVNDFVEFAKMHVEAALKEASEHATGYFYNEVGQTMECHANKDSILNAYPEENIK